MTVTIINDCKDANAAGRQMTRTAALFGQPVTFVGVNNSLEAGGNLIDTIDALGDMPGVVLLNVAPRNGHARKWGNGTPFGYFNYKEILIVISIDGYALSLAKRFKMTEHVKLMDTKLAVEHMVTAGIIHDRIGARTIGSQFRSFDFVPRIAHYIMTHQDTRLNDSSVGQVPTTDLPISEIADVPKAVWWVDNFGNCKTTFLAEDVHAQPGKVIKTKFGDLPFIPCLKDVPDGTAAIIEGSSGLGPHRFLEIVVQGVSAASHFNITSGSIVL